MSDTLYADMTTALAADHRRQLRTEADEHRLGSLAARRRRQLRLRRRWTAPVAVPAPEPA